MCLSHNIDSRPPGSPSLAAALRPNHALQLSVELQESPLFLRVSDCASGEVLVELDGTTNKLELREGEDPSNPTRAALSQIADQLVTALAKPQPLLKHSPAAAIPTALEYRMTEGAKDEQRKTRRKLWDLAHKLHCPVIGTCLDTDELRGIARKVAAQSLDRVTDYDIHVGFVAAAEDKNPLSLATHKVLEKKYARHVKRFARAKTVEKLTELWDKGLACGEVAATLWATMTHPRCDSELKARAFEEIHMLSHQIGAGQRADLKRLTQAEAELVQLRRDFDSAQHRHRHQLEARDQQLLELQKRLQDTEQQRREFAASTAQLRNEISELHTRAAQRHSEQLATELAERKQQLSKTLQRLEVQQRALATAELRATTLHTDNKELAAECAAMEQFITQSLNVCDGCEQSACEDNPDLAGRRILCVGGRVRLIEQYREMVTRCNGRFEHYDGGVEDNRQRLDALLLSADAVVCATDSVSHDAYYRLKRYCKRYEKPHVFLRSSGISSFTRALVGMTG